MPRRAASVVEKSRAEILLRAADLASVEGLARVSIGRLADSAGMSKSGVFGQFRSKQELELAVIERAAEVFEALVFRPGSGLAPGLGRLLDRVEHWLRYLHHAPFRGGCFFAAVAPELDDRPGRSRDRVVALTGGWLEQLRSDIEAASAAGELSASADAAQIAFEIHAALQQANWAFQLHGDGEAIERAARAARRALERDASAEGCALIERLAD